MSENVFGNGAFGGKGNGFKRKGYESEHDAVWGHLSGSAMGNLHSSPEISAYGLVLVFIFSSSIIFSLCISNLRQG